MFAPRFSSRQRVRRAVAAVAALLAPTWLGCAQGLTSLGGDSETRRSIEAAVKDDTIPSAAEVGLAGDTFGASHAEH